MNKYSFYAYALVLVLASSCDKPPSTGESSTIKGPTVGLASSSSKAAQPDSLEAQKVKLVEHLKHETLESDPVTYSNSLRDLASIAPQMAYDIANREIAAPQDRPLHSVIGALGSDIHVGMFPNREANKGGDYIANVKNVLASNLDTRLKNAFVRAASSFAAHDAKASSRLVDAVLDNPIIEQSSFRSIYQDMARGDLVFASRDLLKRDWSDKLKHATARVFAIYAGEKPEAASQLANEIERTHPQHYQWAAVGIVQTIRNVDQDAAKVWKDKIHDVDALNAADAMSYSTASK